MIKPKILVTAAAGRTASAAVHELLAQGFPVRAMVRRDDARAERLRRAGADIFVGDLNDYRDLERALKGVQRAYHCPPFAPNLLHGAMLFAIAAEEAKLEVVALMSGWNPHPTHPAALTREHWIANQVARWMPSVDVIHVNPGLFAITYLLGIKAIVHFGMFAAPFGDGKNAPPSNEDIGRVAAAVLARPEGRAGKSYRPTGPRLITPTDAAAAMSRVLGRKVTYKPSSIEQFLKAATATGASPFDLANVRHYVADLAGGAFAVGAPSGHVEELTGRPSEDFESIARRYFADPDQIAPGLRAGTKLGAFGFLARMLLTRAPDFDKWEEEHLLPRIRSPQLAQDSEEWRRYAAAKELYLLRGASSADERQGERRAAFAS